MTTKNERETYSEIEEEAFKLACKLGFAQAARELNLADSQL
jgi:hypothetical protein